MGIGKYAYMTRRDLEKLEMVIVRQGMEKVRFRLEIM